MFLMDRFFDGTFLTFGIEVISFAERDQEDRIDPMVSYFYYTTFVARSYFFCNFPSLAFICFKIEMICSFLMRYYFSVCLRNILIG